ncbi:MAG: methyltransferase domain-containing protein [Bacteroidales bacterium]|nr:methyltransferase domain-containing protein [Bacteroidales bacterium]
MIRKLHIGANVESLTWEVFNIVPADYVDHIGNAKNLSRFKNNTFSEIYASHVIEHFDYVNELEVALKEWYRVLNKNGKIYVSVPDMEILAQLFLSKNELTLDERFFVMRIIFGGHENEYDYHFMGFNKDLLVHYLTKAGFVNIQKVENFGLFEDASVAWFKNVPISLNMTANKI